MTADPRAVEIRSDSANAEIRTAWQLVYDAVCHRASGTQYAQIRALLVDEIFAALTAAGWSLLPPGGQTEPLGWVVLVQDPNGTRYDDWDGVVHGTLAAGGSALAEALFVDHVAVLARCIAEPSDTPGEPA